MNLISKYTKTQVGDLMQEELKKVKKKRETEKEGRNKGKERL